MTDPVPPFDDLKRGHVVLAPDNENPSVATAALGPGRFVVDSVPPFILLEPITSSMFRDRTDGGEQLADRLREAGVTADVILAIPRGGLPVGRAVADAFDAPLDVVAARKMGAPGNPELAIGAVGATGAAWLNEHLVASLDVDDDYVEAERERQAEAAREKLHRYRGGQPDLAGKDVLLVDDGVATGATMIACVREARDAGAAQVVVGVPVASPRSVEQLRGEADAVYAVETPENFRAVGQFYRQFDQVTDEEAMAYLA